MYKFRDKTVAHTVKKFLRKWQGAIAFEQTKHTNNLLLSKRTLIIIVCCNFGRATKMTPVFQPTSSSLWSIQFLTGVISINGR